MAQPVTLQQAMEIARQHYEAGRLTEAEAAYRQILAQSPDQPEALNMLGSIRRRQGRFDESVIALRRAIAVKKDLAEAHYNLGLTFAAMGNFSRAADAYLQAIRIKPGFVAAHCNLGAIYRDTSRPDEAMDCFRAALASGPVPAEVHNNLGLALQDAGRIEEAIAELRIATRVKPDYAVAHSNLVFATLFHPEYDAGRLLEEARGWAERHERPVATRIVPHQNDRSADRRLRIGYVSPDFRGHPVGRAIWPLLAHHDRNQVEVICYSDVARADAFTERLRGQSDQWRHIAGLSDESAAGQIRQDRVDLLVDTTLHSAKNRLLVFARKPAPVQVTFLGYPGTTGLSGIDYRLTDTCLDPLLPDGRRDTFYSERSVRLPHSFWCYRPGIDTIDVTPPPSLQAGYITFGSFNNFAKLSQPAIELWRDMLQAVHSSRLMVQAPPGKDRDGVRNVFIAGGIEGDRIEFVGRMELEEYFKLYQRVDLCLDPFPYNGHTTTLDAIWMGVPVVTLCGQTSVARGGFSILSNLGQPEWVAHTPQDYVRIAADLAKDPAKLSDLRARLRQRLRESPLMNERQFAADVESAYRQMWREWTQQ